MGLTVVDASVAVKWTLEEADSAAAAQLLEIGDTLLAPELLLVEGVGAITRALRQGRLSLAHVERALDTWTTGLERGAVELVPNSVDLRRAANLSCQLSHAVADCLYLALAERLDARLVTADVTFARRASTDYGAVRLLSDLDNG